VDVGSAHDATWDKKYSLRGLKPEDLTSSKVSRMLRSWNRNTPTELANVGVPWNPFIVCGVLKSNIRADAAWEFFNWVKTQEGYRHNVYTYSAMIDQFGKARNYTAMGSLVEEMRQEGHKLSVVTYTTLIHWYRHAEDLDRVRRIWKLMEENDVKPNVVTYTTYIDALVKGSCHHEAMEVYREMQESGCRANIYTYTVLMHSLVEAGKLEAATELFEKLADVDCKPNSVTYSLIVGAHSKAGNFEKVLSLYRTMRESGLGTSLEQRKIVARALEGLGMAKEAEQLLSGVDEHKVLLKLGSKDATPGEHHEVLGDEAAAASLSLPKPKQLARKLRVWGSETDAILEQVGKRLKPPYVMNVLKELQTNAALAWRFFQWAETQEGYKHTQYTYMKVMEIVGRVSKTGSNELMEKVLAELEQEGINDLDKFNTLIKYYSEYKNIAGAEQVPHYPLLLFLQPL
jgi:pentatricopeptide repeat protein